MITNVTKPIMYGLENILLEKPENRLSKVDCCVFLVSRWLLELGDWTFEKSNSSNERRDVTIGI